LDVPFASIDVLLINPASRVFGLELDFAVVCAMHIQGQGIGVVVS
jgi:hypothetical protein